MTVKERCFGTFEHPNQIGNRNDRHDEAGGARRSTPRAVQNLPTSAWKPCTDAQGGRGRDPAEDAVAGARSADPPRARRDAAVGRYPYSRLGEADVRPHRLARWLSNRTIRTTRPGDIVEGPHRLARICRRRAGDQSDYRGPPRIVDPALAPVSDRARCALGMPGHDRAFGDDRHGPEDQGGRNVVVDLRRGRRMVGSLAGQIAKLHGARVVGIAGGPDKCQALLDRWASTASADYKAPDFSAQLKAACARGPRRLFRQYRRRRHAGSVATT